MDKEFLKKWKSMAFRNKKKVLIGLGVLAILGYSLKGAAPLPVTVQPVEQGTVRKIIEGTATVESLTERTLQGQVSGEVMEIFKDTGDLVKQGDLLALVDVRDINLSVAALEAQKASLASVMAEADNPTAEALRQAEAQVRQDEVVLEAAKRSYDQEKTLFASGAQSAEVLRAAEEAVITAEQAAIISDSAYQALKKGLTPHQQARYLADIAALQSQIDQVKLSRERFRILSPVDGVMTRRSIEPGQVITPGTLLFEIDDPDRLQLTADLLVQDAARINPGILVRAFDEDAGITVTGTVSKIDPKAFSKLSDLGIEQKRIRVEITPDPGTAPLRMGMELDMEVVEAQKEEVLMLPDSSVFKINEKSHVFVVAGDTARLTPVEVGLEGKNAVEILSGLKLGDLVIDAPGNDLKDGAKVKEEE